MYNQDILYEDPAYVFADRIGRMTDKIDSSKCLRTIEQFYHGDPELIDIGDICYKLNLRVSEFCTDEFGREELRYYDNIDQFLLVMPWAEDPGYNSIDRYFFFCLINLDIAKEHISIEVKYNEILHTIKCEKRDGSILIYHHLRSA